MKSLKLLLMIRKKIKPRLSLKKKPQLQRPKRRLPPKSHPSSQLNVTKRKDLG
jgi:hypothetical protein